MSGYHSPQSPPDTSTTQVPLPATTVAAAAARLFWLISGFISLAIAAIGIVLPVLPTTPFVILSAFLFAKGSPALADWLNRNRTFGPIIAVWRANGVIAPRYKLMAIAMMVGAFSLSFAMSIPTAVLIVQALSMVAAAVFILSRPNRAGLE